MRYLSGKIAMRNTFLKGTVCTKMKNTYLSSYIVLFINLGSFGVSFLVCLLLEISAVEISAFNGALD